MQRFPNSIQTLLGLLAAVMWMFALGCATRPTDERPPIRSSLEMGKHDDPHVMMALQALFDGDLNAFSAVVSNTREARRRLQHDLTYLHYAADRGQLEFVEYLIGLRTPLDIQEQVHGLTPLHFAALQGHAPVLARLLAEGARATLRDRQGWQPIHYAAAQPFVPALDALVRGGASPAARTEGRMAGDQPIHIAASAGFVSCMAYLLDAGIDVDARTIPNEQTPLHRAAIKGQTEAVAFLLTKDADVNARNVNGRSALHLAAFYGQSRTVKQLIAHGAEFDTRDIHEITPLIAAADQGHVEVMSLLLNAGAEIEAQCSDHTTPLIRAAAHGHLEAVMFLVGRGANIEARNRNGQTPLYRAASKGHLPIIRFLRMRGANIEVFCKSTGFTPLIVAIRYGHTNVVRELLEWGADKDVHSLAGSSALHVAVYFDQLDVARLLLNYGLDVDLPGRVGTPLMTAVTYNRLEHARLLLDEGADIHRLSPEGDPIISIALSRADKEMVELLLAYGADVNGKDVKIGWTPLFTTAWHNLTNALAVLLEHGADLEASDISGQRPLLIAARRQHHDMMAALLAAGAETYGATSNGLTAWHYARMAGMDETVALIEQVGGPPPDTPELVRVYFELFHPDAKEVLLAGQFNNWGGQRTPMERREDGIWYVEVDIFDVEMGYKFIVDGDWITDPENPNTVTDRGTGAVNSRLTPSERLVANYVPRARSTGLTPVIVDFRYTNEMARQVHVAGEFNGWRVGSLPLVQDDEGVWSGKVKLMPGDYAYKFVADGDWIMDPANDRIKIVNGVENSQVIVSTDP